MPIDLAVLGERNKKGLSGIRPSKVLDIAFIALIVL